MDLLSLLGLALGLVTVVATQLAEGGALRALFQLPAALVVGLGTLGATLLSASREDWQAAFAGCRRAFRTTVDPRPLLVVRFRDLAHIARKDGLVSLENSRRALPTPFMQRAIQHVIDGCEAGQLRDVLECDARLRLASAQAGAHVFEVAGGYAPTMGILGAVLGLVRAMESLSDPEKLGAGIAVAFVATIYGVGLANFVLLPIASRIRSRAARQEAEDELVIEGTIALQSGLSPRTLERLLTSHLPSDETGKKASR